MKDKKNPEEFSRTARLIGEQSVELLRDKRVIIFGVGGVGSYVAEAIARSGVGHIEVVDDDEVAVSNINRQLCALHSTLGRRKAEVVRDRLLDINPDAEIIAHVCRYDLETADNFDFTRYDYIVDAIDSVTSKLLMIERAKAAETPIISSMGTGNKLDPTMLEVSDISKTSVCPLARVMRRELKKRGIESLKVVYSKESPLQHIKGTDEPENNEIHVKQTPGSVPFVPSVAGLIIAREVVLDMLHY